MGLNTLRGDMAYIKIVSRVMENWSTSYENKYKYKYIFKKTVYLLLYSYKL